MRIIKATLEHLDLIAPLFVKYREFYGQPPYPDSSRKFLEKRLKRGESVAKISMKETEQGYEMNDFCQRKFLQFCKAWLNRDKNYVEQLRMRGALKMNQLSYQMVA